MISVGFHVTGVDAFNARLDRAYNGLDPAVSTGVEHTAERATQAMEHRIATAVTATGVARAATRGGHEGRIETGRMIRSLRTVGGAPGRGGKYRGSVTREVGYVNNPPFYTQSQETKPYSLSGVLGAMQAAYNIMSTETRDDVEEHVDDMVRQTERGSYAPRKVHYEPWRG